jgi:N-acetyl-1-D-myo-inositol-2-amino-2-deoxy-alpha-D-glucopyranoside deacetylase
MRAAGLAADPGFRPELGAPWRIAKIYWNRVPRSVARAAFDRLGEALDKTPFDKAATLDDVPGVVDDSVITTEIDGTAFAAAKAAAMRAHATQIQVAEPYFALSNALAQPLLTTEYYELVRGSEEGGPTAGGRGSTEDRETDLFQGVAP